MSQCDSRVFGAQELGVFIPNMGFPEWEQLFGLGVEVFALVW